MLRRNQLEQVESLPLAQIRQQGIFLLTRRWHHFAVAVELENLALGFEDALGSSNLDVRDGEHGRRHLAGQKTIVDQRIKLELLIAQECPDAFRRVGQIGRAHCLVGFLRTFAGGETIRRRHR